MRRKSRQCRRGIPECSHVHKGDSYGSYRGPKQQLLTFADAMPFCPLQPGGLPGPGGVMQEPAILHLRTPFLKSSFPLYSDRDETILDELHGNQMLGGYFIFKINIRLIFIDLR